LRVSVGIEAFLSLAATFENEGLFEGEVLVACDDETVVGFIAFADDEVTWLYVSPDYYRQGIGKKLLRRYIGTLISGRMSSLLYFVMLHDE
jgi:GNAT superfamily N-acetyltransferase